MNTHEAPFHPTPVESHPHSTALTASVKHPVPLPDLIDYLHEVESYENPDTVLDLKDLSFNTRQNLVFPSGAEHALNDWSQRQLGSLLGIRYDKWFEMATPEERAMQMNQRLCRFNGQMKFRTSWARDNSVEADGIVQAIVSPTFSVISDAFIADLLMTENLSLGLSVVRFHRTERTVSYMLGVGMPSYTDREVGNVWGCLSVQNSGVGFCSLTVTLSLVRLVCTNGMTAPVANSVLLRRKHLGIAADDVAAKLTDSIRHAPELLAQGISNLVQSRQRPISNPEEALALLLSRAKIGNKHLPAFLAAYAREPQPSVFGIGQAATDAQTHLQIGLSPEDRLQLENVTGEYLRTM
ncbi:MAG TPA: DUF932 domain-containing protein [Candidatus Ozemobacteraceae bacterium]|nr:DUF932 domain-containing protein [Candidatus Ozemobacteraceae bacterium]